MGVALAQQQPPVKVNVLNVCTPSQEDQQQIAAALDRIPQKTSFTQDFEIDRGRSLLDQGTDLIQGGQNSQLSPDSGTADWVRIRREFPSPSLFSRVQYSFSRDPKTMVETLVFLLRDPKDLMQIAIEDSASPVTTPASMLTMNTPAARIKLERFGKSSIVLARCSASEDHPAPDQSAYEPLFRSASAIASHYRDALGVRHTVPEELTRIAAVSGQRRSGTKAASSTAAKQPQ